MIIRSKRKVFLSFFLSLREIHWTGSIKSYSSSSSSCVHSSWNAMRYSLALARSVSGTSLISFTPLPAFNMRQSKQQQQFLLLLLFFFFLVIWILDRFRDGNHDRKLKLIKIQRQFFLFFFSSSSWSSCDQVATHKQTTAVCEWVRATPYSVLS